jgi:Domain of unknown function (DUF3644)
VTRTTNLSIQQIAFPMVKRSPKNKLETWEIALVKAMLNTNDYNDQDILAYFTRPSRSINHARISEIRREEKHKRINPASDVALKEFLSSWPLVDPETGLHINGDELLLKAREAMLFAVQAYNNPRSYFRSEVFIVTAIIAWTYLMHAHYKSQGIDYRHYKKHADGTNEVAKTKHGAEKFWELAECLKAPDCPLDEGVVLNLQFLTEIRHEIEHRMTQRIDGALSAKLQACCLNFNRSLKDLFGDEYSLEGELSFALQFSGIDFEQKKELMGRDDLPAHIEAMRASFEDKISDDQYRDQSYAYRVLFVPKNVNKKAQADQVVEFVKYGSEEADEMNRVYFKEMEKNKYKPAMVVQRIREEGYPNFSMHFHTNLWQQLDAKNPDKGYGITMSDGQWYWYERWLDRVREHCQENEEEYTNDA